MNLRQAVQAEQEASATQLMQAQIAAAAVALGNPSEMAPVTSEGADGVAMAALDLDSRGRNVQSEETVVSDSAPVVENAPAPVLVAQAAQAESDRKAAAVLAPAAGNSGNKDDDKGAAVAKDDDDKGALWGWLGGLGVLAAAGGGGGGSSAPAPAPAPVVSPESLAGSKTDGAVTESGDDSAGDEVIAGDPTDTGTLVSSKGTVWTAVSETGTYGTFTLDVSGAWEYVLDNSLAAVQELADGETTTESFTVNTPGGGTQTVEITITGTNDQATFLDSSVNFDSVIEGSTRNGGGNAFGSGDLDSDDVDNTPDSWQVETRVKDVYGWWSIDADGNWTYELDNDDADTQALMDSQTPTLESYTFKTADGTEETVTVSIYGANDFDIQLVGGDGLTSRATQDVGDYKAKGTNTPLLGQTFEDGLIVDIYNPSNEFAELVLEPFSVVDHANSAPTAGYFTLVAGSLSPNNEILDYTQSTSQWTALDDAGEADIMILWDEPEVSGNTNYGYVLENVAVDSRFTIEGVEYIYEGAGLISVYVPPVIPG